MDLSKLFYLFLTLCQYKSNWSLTKISKLVEASALNKRFWMSQSTQCLRSVMHWTIIFHYVDFWDVWLPSALLWPHKPPLGTNLPQTPEQSLWEKSSFCKQGLHQWIFSLINNVILSKDCHIHTYLQTYIHNWYQNIRIVQ